MELVLRGVAKTRVAREIGCSRESVRLWVRAWERKLREAELPEKPRTPSQSSGAQGSKKPEAPTAPKDPGAGLSEAEVSAILTYKKRWPTMGPAQLRAQLKRFKGWRLSSRRVARVLREAGYDLHDPRGRPEEPEPPRRWEAPYRNVLFELDFTEVRVPEGRRALGVIIDDSSRFVVGWALLENPRSEDVVAIFKRAIHLHGKPLAIYTDRAGPFLAWGKPEGLQQFLERELIDHYTSRAYRPQGRGKIEAFLGTLKRELWELREFSSEEEAREELERFVAAYNHCRAHLGLDGLTPADRFFGRPSEVLRVVQAQSPRRQGIEALKEKEGITREPPPEGRTEILRLVITGGELELRFFGHRVRLGPLEG